MEEEKYILTGKNSFVSDFDTDIILSTEGIMKKERPYPQVDNNEREKTHIQGIMIQCVIQKLCFAKLWS